jgi:hypothetical protein
VGVVAALVYANSLWNQFTYDDVHIIVENEAIQDLETLPGALIGPYWPEDYGRELGLWRPLTTAVFGVLYAVGGGGALIYHAVNVLAHAGASVLVLLLGATLMPLPASLVAGLVFAVHPVHVEAVSNLVGMAEILSALALLAACLVHLRGPERAGWGRALAIGGLYALAFGTKESGVTLPGLLFLVDAARHRLGPSDLRGYLSDKWKVYAVSLVVAAGFIAARFAVLGSIASPLPPLGGELLAEIPRIWTLAEVWTHYVRLWILPIDLYADYAPNVIPISFGWHADNLPGLLVAFSTLTVALVAWRKPTMGAGVSTARAFAFGVVWFMIAISPTSNTLFLSGVTLAERTLYLPSVGLALASGWLIATLAVARPRAAAVALALILSLSSVRTWTRTPIWRDNPTFFNVLLRDAPHSGRSQWALGDQFLRVGDVSQGLLSYRLAINILGSHYVLVTDISRRLMEIERWPSAERLLLSIYRQNPELPLAPSLIAWVRAQYADPIGTEEYSRASLALYEPDVTRYHLLAWSLAAQGRWEEAKAARARADELRLEADIWHRWLYWAYVRRHEGDSLGMQRALDSAWVSVATTRGRQAMDSVRVADFGLAPSLVDSIGP